MKKPLISEPQQRGVRSRFLASVASTLFRVPLIARARASHKLFKLSLHRGADARVRRTSSVTVTHARTPCPRLRACRHENGWTCRTTRILPRREPRRSSPSRTKVLVTTRSSVVLPSRRSRGTRSPCRVCHLARPSLSCCRPAPPTRPPPSRSPRSSSTPRQAR